MKIPVTFRIDPTDHWQEVTAVFLSHETHPTRNAADHMCYAHVGQHSECSRHWLLKTRPATPAEYAPLLRELEQLYNTDGGTLVVRKRIKPVPCACCGVPTGRFRAL